MNDQQVCSACTGTGKCSGCDGTGNEKRATPGPRIGDVDPSPGGAVFRKSCARCNGAGSCQKCHGSGKVG
jgi:hypothetical protein